MKSRSLEEKKKYYFTITTFGNKKYAAAWATLKSARAHAASSNAVFATLQQVSLRIVDQMFKGDPVFTIEPIDDYFKNEGLLGTVAYSTRARPGDTVIYKPTHGIA